MTITSENGLDREGVWLGDVPDLEGRANGAQAELEAAFPGEAENKGL